LRTSSVAAVGCLFSQKDTRSSTLGKMNGINLFGSLRVKSASTDWASSSGVVAESYGVLFSGICPAFIIPVGSIRGFAVV